MRLRRLLWPFRTGLARRLTVINLLALLPLLALAAFLARAWFIEVKSNQAQAALGLTVRAAEPQIDLIKDARTLAQTLAALAPDSAIHGSDESCSARLDLLAAHYPLYTLIGYIRPDGVMACASHGHRYDFTGSDLWERMKRGGNGAITLERHGPVSRLPVLSVSAPVRVPGSAGDSTGLIVVSIPQHVIHTNTPPDREALPKLPLGLMTFDREGQLLTTSVTVSQALQMIPRNHDLSVLARNGTASFVGEDYTGTTHSYAVVPLTSELFLLGIWSPDVHGGMTSVRISPGLIFVLVLISCFTAATLAADRLVTRHVRSLAEAMESFAGGARQSYRSTLYDPPAEIASLAETYDQLTETIQREEAELENLLREKEILLREVHHRTGNSMQLIASILRMHIRETSDPAQKEMLDNLYGRVMILSTVHLGLYRTSGYTSLDMQRLFTDVISRVDMLHRSPERSVQAEIAPLLLPPQQAVPLALMLSEVLPAFYNARTTEAGAPIRVLLSANKDQAAVFAIEGPDEALPRLNGTDGTVPSQIGARLLRNFVRQLDGEMHLIHPAPGRMRFEMGFTIRQPLPGAHLTEQEAGRSL